METWRLGVMVTAVLVGVAGSSTTETTGNDLGTSEEITTEFPVTVCPPPNDINETELHFLPLNSTTLNLTWIDSVNDAEVVTRYNITWNISTDSVTHSSNASSYTYLISGLESGKVYQVKLQTIGLCGSTDGVMKYSSTYPAVPGNVSAESQTTSSIQIQWTASVGEVDHYYVVVEDGEDLITWDTNNTDFNITGLSTPGALYTIWVIANSNGINSSNSGKITNPTHPEVPVNLTVTGVTTTSISVEWQHPKGEVDYYIVGYRVVSNDDFKWAAPGNHTNVTLTNLTPPGVLYEITVVANSNDLNSSEAVIKNQGTPPAIPTSVTVSPVSTTSLYINWTQPDSSVDNYTITLVDRNGGENVTHTSDNDTFYQIDKLVPGAAYNVTVMANSNGISSDESEAEVGYLYPAMPENVTVTSQTTSTVSVVWEPSIGYVDHYTINVVYDNGTECHFITDNNPNFTITDLGIPGALYNISVLAESNNRTSSTYVTQAATVPEIVTGLKVTGENTSAIHLNWTEAKGRVHEYYVEVQLLGETEKMFYSVPGTLNAASAAGLAVPGAKYNITTITNSNDLNSTYSERVISRTQPPMPFAVRCYSINKRDIKLNVSKPTDDVYEIEGVTVVYKSLINDDLGNTSVNTTMGSEEIILEQLTPGHTYLLDVFTTIDELKSVSIQHNCTSALDEAKQVLVTEETETSLEVAWSNPDGHYDTLVLTCTGMTGLAVTRTEVFELEDANITSARCDNLTAGAVYQVNINTSLDDAALALPAQSNTQINVTVPYEPVLVDVSTDTAASLLLNITYGYESDIAQCTHFHVVHSTGGKESTLDIPCDETHYVITGLLSDASYDIDVRTTSNYSEGLRQSVANTSDQAWTLPEAVRDIIVDEAGRLARSLNVQWETPEGKENVCQYEMYVRDDVGCIVYVSMEITGQGSECILEASEDCTYELSINISHNDANLNYTVPHLTPYHNYTTEVLPVNPGGRGLPNDSGSVETDQSTPGCVNLANGSLVYVGRDAFEIDFDFPDEPNGIILNYTAQYTCDKCDDTDTNTITPERRTLRFDHLIPYQRYQVKAFAWTIKGNGSICNISYTSATTLIGAPFAPTNTKISPSSHEAVRVEWDLERNLETSNETYYNVTVTEVVNSSLIYVETVTGFNNRNVTVQGLRPFRNHTVEVTAYIYNETKQLFATVGLDRAWTTTRPWYSGPVAHFETKSLSSDNICYDLYANWSRPVEDNINGNITHYIITYVDQNNYTEEKQVPSLTSLTTHLDVNANNYSYDIFISAETQDVDPVTNGNLMMTSSASSGICAPTAPPDGGADTVGSTGSRCLSCNKKKQFSVTVNSSFIDNQNNGELTLQGLIIEEIDDNKDSENEHKDFASISDLDELYGPWRESYEGAYRINFTKQETPGARASRRRRNVVQEFLVGADDDCEGKTYCNGPLNSNRRFRIRAVTCTLGGCYVTKYAVHDDFRTDAVSLAWIAGVVMGVLVVVVVFLIGGVIILRRRQVEEQEVRIIGLDETPKGPVPAPGPQLPVDAMPLDEFAALVRKWHADSDFVFSYQYEILGERSPQFEQKSAKLPANQSKNRYVDILPFDNSRVKLLPIDDEEGSDYINASYIPGYSSSREYIAAQGPKPNTTTDFWRMIWEQRSPLIVMLTQCVEERKTKCAQYWPSDNSPVYHGDLHITLTSETQRDHYTTRVFRIQLGDVVRTVEQYHFLKWDDHGVPSSTGVLLDFVKVVRAAIQPSQHGPTLVHCSAGVGRTGTFIALDGLLQHMKDNDEVDIFTLALEMRQHRPKMIQSEAQYIFVFDSVADELMTADENDEVIYDEVQLEETLECPHPLPQDQFQAYVVKMENENLYQDQYQLLNHRSPSNQQTTAQLGINRKRNRYIDILPFEHARVRLHAPTGNPASDYINASVITGNSSETEYIAAQGPNANTIHDFWRMLWEQNIEAIVMVTKCVETDKKKCEQYWPSSAQGQFYGEVKVRVTDSYSVGQHIVRTLNVRRGGVSRTISQFHYTTWPDFGCPSNAADLVNFAWYVRDKFPPASDRPPIVVHCSAGVGRTGTFIVVDRLLQDITDGADIDIFGVVMELRQNRPKMVQSLAQYRFLHECIGDVIGGAITVGFEEPLYGNVNEGADDMSAL